jgi:hypothetical protein
MEQGSASDGIHVSGSVTGNIAAGGAKIKGGMHTSIRPSRSDGSVSEAINELERAIAQNSARVERVDDLKDSVDALKAEVDSGKAKPGALRTLLTGIAALAPGVSAIAEAVARVREAIGG